MSLAFSPGELACFEKVDAKNFVAPVVEPRVKTYRGLRGCKSWACLVKRARPSRKVLQVFITKKNIRPRVNFGNLGWARQNIAIVTDVNQITDALLIARGVENYNVGQPEELGDLLNHDNFVAEVKCLREAGFKERSFNEVQAIP